MSVPSSQVIKKFDPSKATSGCRAIPAPVDSGMGVVSSTTPAVLIRAAYTSSLVPVWNSDHATR